MLYNNILDAIGNTPLIRLTNIEKKYNLGFNLYAKMERSNPSGSVKDRAALYIIKDAIDKGLIKENTEIIEATSGNTGISLSMISSYLKHKCTLIMPSSASIERIKIMKAYGANVILTDASLGMKGSVELAEKMHNENPDSFIADQFNNESNIKAHYEGTSKEIIRDLDGKIDAFIAGYGTAGTLSGCSKRFKEYNPNILTVGVAPLDSPHKIQGIGANFTPNNLKKEYVDDVTYVSNKDAYEGARILSKEEGIFAGISSGAALMGAINYNRESLKGKNVVIVLPDNGERYLSVEGLYE